MPPTRALALLAVALLATGCFSEEPAAVDAAGNVTDAPGPDVVAPVDDGTKTVEQAAADTGHMPHVHDYWQGRERVTLFEGEIEPDQENATFATIFQVLSRQGVYAGGMLWRFPDGTTVYEGAGALDITATWSDPRVTGIAYMYRSADSPDYKDGDVLASGVAHTLPVDPSMTDMPHGKVSRWEFGFGPAESPGAVLGPFHLKIDIVRLDDVMTFPAHPDFWQGAHELVLMDASHHGEVPSYVKRAAQPATQGNFTEDTVKIAKPVPMETKALRFEATITAASSTPGEVTSFGFFYHGADRTDLLRCSLRPVPGALPQTLTWIVPVTMEETDSPYSPSSQWQFLVEPIVTLAPGTPEMGGMTDVSYDYDVVVTAFDAASEEAETCNVNNGGG